MNTTFAVYGKGYCLLLFEVILEKSYDKGNFCNKNKKMKNFTVVSLFGTENFYLCSIKTQKIQIVKLLKP